MLSSVLELHRPVRRYQAASSSDTLTYPTAERAHQINSRHSMRGYESIIIGSPADAPYIEVCAECSRIGNDSIDDLNGYGDEHDDHRDGSELSMKASLWLCRTYQAIDGAR